MTAARKKITKTQYERLGAFRHGLGRFLRFSHEAARRAGLRPQQHQALLAIKGFPGRDYVSVRELAERLHVKHNSAVGLVDRLEERGLIRRSLSKQDARQLDIRLTKRGEALIEKLSQTHLQELRSVGPQLRELLVFVDTA